MQPVGLRPCTQSVCQVKRVSNALIVYASPQLPKALNDLFKGTEQWEHANFGQALYEKYYSKIVVLIPTPGEILMLPGEAKTFEWYTKEYLPQRLMKGGEIHYLHFHNVYSIIKSDG